jgi:hypothetical protein
VKKVAILGTVPVSKMLAPFDDHEWQIWVCSPGNRGGCIPRVTCWFELHGVEDMKGPENRDWAPEYFAWLRSQSFPVYMQEPSDLLPQAMTFPRDRWLVEFGNFGRMAATSSIPLMIGFAIMEGATEIGVFGVDMAADSEAYSGQKAGCLIMMEIARQRGIRVTVPLESCLATMPPFYGYAEASRMGRKLLVKEMELQVELQNLRTQDTNLVRQMGYVEGALDTTRYMRRTWVDGVSDAELDIEGAPVAAQAQNGAGPAWIAEIIPNPDVDVERTPGGVLVPTRRTNSGAARKEI